MMKRSVLVGCTGIGLTALISGCAPDPLSDHPGFTPAQVTTYNAAVDHLAPKYGANPSAVKKAGVSNPTSLNHGGASWEYVVNDDRYLHDSTEGDTSCLGINASGVWLYERTEVSHGDNGFGSDTQYACEPIERKLAEQDPWIWKLSADGKTWKDASKGN